MTTFNLPASITLTNPTNVDWGSIVPRDTYLDTATKKHYAAVGSSGATDIFFEINNGVITADVNTSPAANAPDSISKTGFSNGTDSVTVSAGDTLYLFNNGGTQFGSFVWQSSWTSSGTGTEGVSVNSIFVESSTPWVSGTIASSEPTGSYPVSVGGVLVQGALVTNPISHTNGTESQFTFPISYGGYGAWILHQNYVASALNTPIASVLVSDPSILKKVHCNFW